MKLFTKLLLVGVAALLLVWLRTAVFVVEPTNTAIVTRFSRPLDKVLQPGPHLKLPWPIDSVITIDKRLLVFRYLEPTEFLTQDRKNILVDSYGLWRVGDEHRFLKTVRNREGAEARMLDMITATLGEVVGGYPLSSFINVEAEKVQLNEINRRIVDLCKTRASENYGIEIVDIRIKSFNFPPQNRASVIRRMQAERARIATKYRSQGAEEALKIEAETEMERRRLLAKARREAKVTLGKGEAKAIRIYGEAYKADPEFYRFLRTLEAYEKLIDEDTTIILRSDSEPWRLLNEGADR